MFVISFFFSGRKRRISVKEVDVNNLNHVAILKELGINVHKEDNGRIQLQHQSHLVRISYFFPHVIDQNYSPTVYKKCNKVLMNYTIFEITFPPKKYRVIIASLFIF